MLNSSTIHNESSNYDDYATSDDKIQGEHGVNYANMIFSILLCTVGLFGNLLAIFIVVVLKEYKKSVTHWYILQLAIADSMFLLTLPFKVSETLHGRWIYQEWFCKAKETILFINYYASILFLTIMSLDRYFAVCHSFRNILQQLRTQKSAYLVSAIAWGIALALSTPVMIYSAKSGVYPFCVCSYEIPFTEQEECFNDGFKTIEECLKYKTFVPHEGEKHCRVMKADFSFYESEESGVASGSDVEDIYQYQHAEIGSAVESAHPNDTSIYYCRYSSKESKNFNIFLIVNFIVMFLLPLLIIIVCYWLIILKISFTKTSSSNAIRRRSYNTLHTSGLKKNESASQSERKRRRVTIMCATLVVVFVVCWLPFHSVHLAKIVGFRSSPEQNGFCNILSIITSLLAYLNSVLNPFLYSFLGTNFSRRYNDARTVLRRSIRRRRSSSSMTFGSFRSSRKQSAGDLHSNRKYSSGFLMTKITRSDKEQSTRDETLRFADGISTTMQQKSNYKPNATKHVETTNL